MAEEIIPGACKFCGAKLELRFDTAAENMFTRDYWVGLAACNRCADYREKLWRIEDWIQKACQSIAQARLVQGERQSEIIAKSETMLVAATKRLATLVCGFYRMANTWERSMVDVLMEKPYVHRKLVRHYLAGIEKESKAAHQPAEQQTLRPTHPDP